MAKFKRRRTKGQTTQWPNLSEEEQTTQWPKEKVQKDKQQSTKHTHKTKDRVTQTPLKVGSELRCPGSSCSTSGTRRLEAKYGNVLYLIG